MDFKTPRPLITNTFGEAVKSHIDAIEEEYAKHISTMERLRRYFRENDLEKQPKESKRKLFMYLTFTPYCKELRTELLPAEFGIVVFSLLDGIVEARSALVDPGYIPFGERGEVTSVCEVMGLPLPQRFKDVGAEGVPYYEVLRRIGNLAEKFDLYMDDEVLIFATRGEFGIVHSCMNWMRRKAAEERVPVPEINYRIISLEMLVMELSRLKGKESDNDAIVQHEGGAAKFIFHTRYDFDLRIACKWHQKEHVGKVENCASNISLRRVYNALYYLCHLFHIPIQHVTHKPPLDKKGPVDTKHREYITTTMKNLMSSKTPQKETRVSSYIVEENVKYIKAVDYASDHSESQHSGLGTDSATFETDSGTVKESDIDSFDTASGTSNPA